MLAPCSPHPSDPGEDAALLRAHEGGDPRAFETLYDRYYSRTVRYAWRMLRRREEAEELCTEVFLQLHQGAWTPHGSIQGLLFTVVHRRCVDRLRQRNRILRLREWIPWGRQAPESPEQVALLSERQQRLEAAIGTLPEKHRSTLLLYYGQELSSREVAEILECTDQEVRSRLSYARKKLRSLLQEDADAI